MSAHRTIHGLRILDRGTRQFVEVFGADRNEVLSQDAAVYEQSPFDTYAVQRLTADVADYLAEFDDCPAFDAPAQAWAEYIWTPGGITVANNEERPVV